MPRRACAAAEHNPTFGLLACLPFRAVRLQLWPLSVLLINVLTGEWFLDSGIL